LPSAFGWGRLVGVPRFDLSRELVFPFLRRPRTTYCSKQLLHGLPFFLALTPCTRFHDLFSDLAPSYAKAALLPSFPTIKPTLSVFLCFRPAASAALFPPPRPRFAFPDCGWVSPHCFAASDALGGNFTADIYLRPEPLLSDRPIKTDCARPDFFPIRWCR